MSAGTSPSLEGRPAIYVGDWADWPEGGYARMRRDFDVGEGADFPPSDAILYAEYTYECYDGSAFVLYEQDGKLFEVHGGHCSCYGLEGQWAPEETSWAALAMRPRLPQPVAELVALRSRLPDDGGQEGAE